MLECNKRQKVVKRSKDLVVLRCVNRKCEAFGQEVTEEICSICPVRSFKHVRPCKKEVQGKPVQPSVDRMSDGQVVELLENSPLDMNDLDLTREEGEAPEYPKMSLQLWLYKEAVMKWNKAGRPVRSDEEVERIHEDHCKPCSWYDPEKKRCKGCGCKVSNGAVAVFNKIKMATEHCPRELW